MMNKHGLSYHSKNEAILFSITSLIFFIVSLVCKTAMLLLQFLIFHLGVDESVKELFLYIKINCDDVCA